MALGQHNARAQTLLQWWLQRTGWCGKSKATIMKNKILLFAALAAVSISLLTPAPAAAQSSSAAGASAGSTNALATTQTFIDSADAYFTSFNTNFTWTNVSFEISTGYKQVTGVGAANSLELQYDFPSKWTVLAAFQFSGVGSPLNTAEAGAGYQLIQKWDAVLELDALLGYDWNSKALLAEPSIKIKKKLTTNTYAAVGLSLPIESVGKFNRNPTLDLETGVTF